MAIIVIPQNESLPTDLEKTLSVKNLNKVKGIVLFSPQDSLHPWVNSLLDMGHARCDRGVVGQELVNIPTLHEKVVMARGFHQHVFVIVEDENAEAVVEKVKEKLAQFKCSVYKKQ